MVTLDKSEEIMLKKFRSLSTLRKSRILERINIFIEEQREEQDIEERNYSNIKITRVVPCPTVLMQD